MKVAVFDTHTFEKQTLLESAEKFGFKFTFYEARLNQKSVKLAHGFDCVCVFVNDHLNSEVLTSLKEGGVKLVALRCAGFNQVDLKAAKELGIKVVRVPEYSPYAVAEHAVALLLTLNRKIHKSYNRVREGNFSLDGLVGFDLHGKTVGVIGTGKIGKVFARIMKGFGCHIVAYDINPDDQFASEVGLKYMELDLLLQRADVVSLHIPLDKKSFHLIDAEKFKIMKKNAYLINTSRGGLIHTKALIEALKLKKIAGAGLDVYEEEEDYFFQDHSGQMLNDDILARLMTFPNVILTGHQAFLTKEALINIAQTTLDNMDQFQKGLPLKNQV